MRAVNSMHQMVSVYCIKLGSTGVYVCTRVPVHEYVSKEGVCVCVCFCVRGVCVVGIGSV